jgi:hypothetical protein
MGWRDWFTAKVQPEPISDPDLGLLHWRPEDGGWTGVRNGLSFTIGDEADSHPSESLRIWALKVLSDTAFLDRSLSEAIDQAPTHYRRFDREMRGLRYSHLYFSESAKGKSIFAALAPESEHRCWRLEFDGEKCLGIGFDT